MASKPRPNDEPRTPLSRSRVLAAAIELADEAGIEALTMRRLAQAVGVEAMTLYYHVANKEDIVDGIVDLVVGEIELPAAGRPWRTALRATAIAAHEVLVRHPWACGLMMTAKAGPERMLYMDAILGRLREGGFSARMTHHAYHALDSHIVGFTMWETGYTNLPGYLDDLARTFLSELPADAYPFLAEHIQEHLEPSGDEGGSEFEFGLDLILDGLERMQRAS